MAYADRVPSSRRLTTLAAVAAIHGLIGYVFVSGMAASFVTTVTTELTIRNIPLETPPPPDPAPQPTQIASKQQPTQTIVTPMVVPSESHCHVRAANQLCAAAPERSAPAIAAQSAKRPDDAAGQSATTRSIHTTSATSAYISGIFE